MSFNSSYFYDSSGRISFCWFMTGCSWFHDVCWIDKGPKIYWRTKSWSLIKTTRHLSSCCNFFFKSPNKIDSKSLSKLHGLKCKPPLLKAFKVMSLFLIISRYKSCKCLFCLIAVKLELSLSVRVIKLEVVNPV